MPMFLRVSSLAHASQLLPAMETTLLPSQVEVITGCWTEATVAVHVIWWQS